MSKGKFWEYFYMGWIPVPPRKHFSVLGRNYDDWNKLRNNQLNGAKYF